jgi:HEAT repeat protein
MRTRPETFAEDGATPLPLPELLRTVLHDPDLRRRQAAGRALVSASSYHTPAVQELTGALQHEEPMVRRTAAHALFLFGPQACGALSALAVALKDRSWPVREAAALALGQVSGGGPPADEQAAVMARLALVQASLRDGHALVRTAAARALTQLGSQVPAAIADLRQALQHPHVSARRRAGRALAHFCDQAAVIVPALRKALQDSHGKVRLAVMDALGRLGGLAAPALSGLVKRFYDRDWRARKAAAAALAQVAEGLTPGLRSWLAVLANPNQGPEHNLKEVLHRSDLPEPARQEFIKTCQHRVLWQRRLQGMQGEEAGQVPLSAWEAAAAAVGQAEQTAVALVASGKDSLPVQRTAREQEAAWLLAWLGGLLQKDQERGKERVPDKAP